LGKQLFGTDGIRGVAGEYPLDPATVYAFGAALADDIKAHQRSPEVLIGADTRESSEWIAQTAAGGIESRGVKVRYAGVITTPGVACLTRTGPFGAGVMISASHNPYHDNGLKVFGHSGFKLPDAEEHEIEQEILALRAQGLEPAKAKLAGQEALREEYVDYLASSVSGGFSGLKLVLDCGNGAAFQIAPQLFRRLGAEIVVLNASPDGRNINAGCGALHVEGLSAAVVAHRADAGVAFDGDADRAIFASASGKIVNGDAVMLLLGRAMKASGHLAGDTVVSTVMSNLGLERALGAMGIRMLRTPVGDKYVLEEMVRIGAALGGEQSGHIILREVATTGDGILTALRVFETLLASGRSLDELTEDLQVYPQTLVNVRVREKQGLLDLPAVKAEIARVEREFGETGRVLVRFSGTEPLARVMVEGPDLERVERYGSSIAEVIRREMGA
jgi:phosphoglucosamine mutase